MFGVMSDTSTPQDKLVMKALAEEMRAHPEPAKEMARFYLLSEEYLEWLRYRISTQSLSENIEKMLWTYGFGSPKQTIKVETNDPDELNHATPDEIAQRAEELVQMASAAKITRELAEDLKNKE